MSNYICTYIVYTSIIILIYVHVYVHHTYTLSGCAWIDNALFTDNTLKRNGK